MTDEEMANEYADRTETKDWEGFDITREVRKQAFFAGLKAGRPQWHYVKDGDYPKNESKVLCILGDFENANLEVGYYSQVEGDSNRWRFNDYDLPDDSEEEWGVSAWKEIVLPELKESE